MEKRAIQACWIINRSGFAKKATRLSDLIKPEIKESETMTAEEQKKFIEESLAFHKTKFWGLIPDEYAKK